MVELRSMEIDVWICKDPWSGDENIQKFLNLLSNKNDLKLDSLSKSEEREKEIRWVIEIRTLQNEIIYPDQDNIDFEYDLKNEFWGADPIFKGFNTKQIMHMGNYLDSEEKAIKLIKTPNFVMLITKHNLDKDIYAHLFTELTLEYLTSFVEDEDFNALSELMKLKKEI